MPLTAIGARWVAIEGIPAGVDVRLFGEWHFFNEKYLIICNFGSNRMRFV